MAGFAEYCRMFPYMVDSVRRTLFSSDPIGEIEQNDAGWTVEFFDWADPANQTRQRPLNKPSGWKFIQGAGIHRGHLLGGCFEVLDWLRGTEWWPDLTQWQDAILFLETSEEAPTPTVVKYTLRTMAAMGILKRLSGILFGRPGGNVPPEKFSQYDEAILQVVRAEEGLINLPIITHMDFGHTDPFFVLPYGVQAEIDCDQQRFSILESGVNDYK
jgi:muramoyltetrapeptide carboxypeptidase LdcA involved in peptidoglycan recycling